MERRKFTREFQLEAVRLIKDRGVSVAQASIDLGVHQSQLRGRLKKFADDPQHAFPGNWQMVAHDVSEVDAKMRAVVSEIEANQSLCPSK